LKSLCYDARSEKHQRNKLTINSASSWLLLHRYIETHGQQNIKGKKTVKTTSYYLIFTATCCDPKGLTSG